MLTTNGYIYPFLNIKGTIFRKRGYLCKHSMKRIISISYITAAMLCLLALTVLPHHHNGGTICFGMEVCEHTHSCDHECGDGHSHGTQDDGHSHSCVAESEFISPQSEDDITCRISSCDNHNHNHFSLFPVYFLAADLLNTIAENPILKIDYGEYTLFYKSAEPVKMHGLRAPPIGLS